MRCDVHFIFNPTQTLQVQLNMELTTALAATSQQWLVEKWEELECEPLRPSGKVLVLDRILGVTDAMGYEFLRTHPEQRELLARHCVNALSSPNITVDLPGLVVNA
ncbi:hypothetical protein MIM_c23440 [Advenella mimigardefordensis DPN7]|uniref:Uncharacterized protein n=2 Tax=Advenella mimigardefordensis TaxID=302406 RepID=W0PHJ1_ADVMD|nr:hypothetical protein [Advenella mimigardefordensis]AHG64418.1 hypothetical protein MIM_c23440 [Advenella mimigardefordensis DPN7]